MNMRDFNPMMWMARFFSEPECFDEESKKFVVGWYFDRKFFA
jgi:hypothetical protein